MTTTFERTVGLLGAGRQAQETLGYMLALGMSPSFCMVDPEYAAQAADLGLQVWLTTDDLRALAGVPVIAAVGAPAETDPALHLNSAIEDAHGG